MSLPMANRLLPSYNLFLWRWVYAVPVMIAMISFFSSVENNIEALDRIWAWMQACKHENGFSNTAFTKDFWGSAVSEP